MHIYPFDAMKRHHSLIHCGGFVTPILTTNTGFSALHLKSYQATHTHTHTLQIALDFFIFIYVLFFKFFPELVCCTEDARFQCTGRLGKSCTQCWLLIVQQCKPQKGKTPPRRFTFVRPLN